MPLVQGPRGKLHYETYGEGENLVLLHGMWSHQGIWKKIIPRLSTYHFVVTPDSMGHGKSDPIRRQYHLTDYADDLDQLLDSIGVERVALIGFSMGALISEEYYFQHPTRVNSLILIAVPPPYKLSWSLAMRFVCFLESLGITSFKKQAIRALSRRYSTGTNRDLINKSVREIDRYEDREFGFVVRSAFVRRKEGWASRIHVPTMILVGERDRSRPNCESLQRAIPDSRFVLVPEADHSLLLEKPDVVSNEILRFLADVTFHRA